MTPKLGKYNLIDRVQTREDYNPNTPLNPNLDNCGPWKQGHKSPKYNLKYINDA